MAVIIAGLIGTYVLAGGSSTVKGGSSSNAPTVNGYVQGWIDFATPVGSYGPLPPVMTSANQNMKLVDNEVALTQSSVTVTVQNPEGTDALEVLAIQAVNIKRAPALAGIYVSAPPQGAGSVPTLAIDFDSSDPSVRTFDFSNVSSTAEHVGLNYFASGHYLSVDGGGTQSFTLYAISTRDSVTFNLSIIYVVDGRQHEVLASDGSGRPETFAVTALSASYEAAYYLSTGSNGDAVFAKTSWSTCLTLTDCKPAFVPIVQDTTS